MNKKRYFNLLNGALLLAGTLTGVSCSDEWNEHYLAQDEGMANAPSLMANIRNDEDLANFARVLDATGYSSMLENPSMYTVFAPKLKNEQVDSIINLYNLQKGKHDDENTAISQFVNQHISLYGRNFFNADGTVYTQNDVNNNGADEFYVDTIAMVNGKYLRLMPKSATELYVGPNSNAASVKANKIAGLPVISNNGYLYKIEGGSLEFLRNLRESIMTDDKISDLNAFLHSPDVDTTYIDENQSVPGEVIDGKIHYIDSVMSFKNTLYNSNFAHIKSEDSTYLFVAPTNEVWNRLYDEYKEYFKYSSDKIGVTEDMAKEAILWGRFFNRNSKYNRHTQDSLCSTLFHREQAYLANDNRRTEVFYAPYGEDGILNGLDTMVCSNGVIAYDNVGKIDKAKTFFVPSAIRSDYNPVKAADNVKDKFTFSSVTARDSIYEYSYDDEKEYTIPLIEDGKIVYKKYPISGHSYSVLKTPDAQTDRYPYVDFALKNVMSNVYYNIYVVTVPADADGNIHGTSSSTYPGAMIFNARIWNAQETTQSAMNEEYDQGLSWTKCIPALHQYNNVAVNGKAYESLFGEKQVWHPTEFVDNAADEYHHVPAVDEVDYIQVASAVKFDYAGYGGEVTNTTAPYYLRICGRGTAGLQYSYQETVGFQPNYYTTDVRINRVILVPFEDEADAKDQTLEFDSAEGKARIIKEELQYVR